jgi:DNA-binding XRE family transcriptional regulator
MLAASLQTTCAGDAKMTQQESEISATGRLGLSSESSQSFHRKPAPYSALMARLSRQRTPVPKARALSVRIGRGIRQLREQRGLSQAALGAPYLTRQAVSSLERAVTSPSIHVLAFLAKRLRVEIEDLLRPR